MTPRAPGFTLTELLFVLVLMSALAGVAAPGFSAALDRVAVTSAVDAFAAQVTRARALALARGGARLVLDVSCGCSWVADVHGQRASVPVWFEATHGVALQIDGARGMPVELAFDALGIGRLVNRTLRFRRGSFERRTTLSAYGRVRTW